MGRKQPEPFTLKNIPVDQGFQLHQLMPHVDHLDQAGAQEVVLVRSRLFWLHITSRKCRVSAPTIPDPASLIQQISAVYQYNQIPNRCSGRTNYTVRSGKWPDRKSHTTGESVSRHGASCLGQNQPETRKDRHQYSGFGHRYTTLVAMRRQMPLTLGSEPAPNDHFQARKGAALCHESCTVAIYLKCRLPGKARLHQRIRPSD